MTSKIHLYFSASDDLGCFTLFVSPCLYCQLVSQSKIFALGARYEGFEGCRSIIVDIHLRKSAMSVMP